jgi:hypothetical protein
VVEVARRVEDAFGKLKELKGLKEFFRFAQDDTLVILSSRAKRGISFNPFNLFNLFN